MDKIARTSKILAPGLFTLLFTVFGLSAAKADNSDISLIGAIPQGSENGLVPPWQNGLSGDYEKVDGRYVDPFADEEPLFVISSKNYQEHTERLTPGLIAMLKRYPDTFTIPVYPSHRVSTYPAWYFDLMRQPSNAQISGERGELSHMHRGVNFPQPENGLQAVWNHLTRWRGKSYVRNMAETTVFEDGAYRLIKSRQEVSFNQFRSMDEGEEVSPVLVHYLSTITHPAKLSGGGLLVIDYVNSYQSPRKAWAYNPHERRARRLPEVSYDTASSLADGLRSADESDMYNGSPDRYNWVLKGREIKYIPYNNYQLSSGDVSYEKLLTPYHLNPQYTRYEAHRVWVVEGTLKEGANHIYKKRTFYIDEDSWSIVLADQYDLKGDIWRVSLGYLKHYYDVPVTFYSAAVFHDLSSKRYNVHGLTNEEPNPDQYSDEYKSPSYFRPANLKRLFK